MSCGSLAVPHTRCRKLISTCSNGTAHSYCVIRARKVIDNPKTYIVINLSDPVSYSAICL